MSSALASVSLCVSAAIVALLSTSAYATNEKQHAPTTHRRIIQASATQKAKAVFPKPSKSKHRKSEPVAPKPYLINGICLTDLREIKSRSNPHTAPPLARKYPGVDLLVTVVAEGKIILSPRALRLKLPPPGQISAGAIVDSFAFSSDGLRLDGLVHHGEILNDAFTTYMDFCVVDSTDGRVRPLTRNRFFGSFTSSDHPWSPDHRQIAAVEQLDKFPFPYYREHTRLVVLDAETGASQTLSDRHREKNGRVDRIYWTTSKAGERGVVFRVENAMGMPPGVLSVRELAECGIYEWFFVPVPLSGGGIPGAERRLAESDLPDYSVFVFPGAIIKALKTSRFELVSSSPRGDLAVFYRDDSGVAPVNDAGPEGLYMPWIEVDGGRTVVLDATGKILVNQDRKQLGASSEWTWDGFLLIDKDELLALNPRPLRMRWAVVPPLVSDLREHWRPLSPAEARRAAAQWQHLPKH